MKKIAIPLLAMTFLVSGCKSTAPKVEYFPISIPELNIVSETTLGSNLLLQATGNYAETVVVEPFEAYYGAIPNRTVFYKSVGVNFESNTDNSVIINNGFGEPLRAQNYIQYKPEDNEVCIDLMLCYDSTEANFKYSPEKTLRVRKNGLQRVIEYNGKTGDTLRFTYREFSDSMARSAFTTDFMMDLSEGNEIAYKGAVIEVIQATNSKIKYKVLSNFNTSAY
ncbi:hypothetical protein [Pseudoalteromonas lipolytica]